MTAKAARRNDDLREQLLRSVEQAYRRASWLEATLKSSIRGLDHEEAGWHPPHLKHSMAEIVLHCAYWKNRVRHRISGDRSRSFPLRGRDWIRVEDELDELRWAEIRRISDEEHKLLCAAIREIVPNARKDHARYVTQQVRGIAMHDVYHTGQIKLIRAMFGRMKAR